MREKIVYLLFKIGCISVFLSQFVYAQGVQDTSVSELMNSGYKLIETSPLEAIQYFERVIEVQPSNLQARRQLGYLYDKLGKYTEALIHFNAAEAIQSSDIIKLQIAYVYLAQNNREAANKILSELLSSTDSVVNENASRLLLIEDKTPTEQTTKRQFPVLQATSWDRMWWTHIYAAPYYDARWKSMFALFHIRRGFYFTDDERFSLMGVILLSGDNRSEGGRAPRIFSDNALVVGLGLRFQPFSVFHLDIQEGVAFEFIERKNKPKTKSDFRTVATYSIGWYAGWEEKEEISFPFDFFADKYLSVGYYSRYDNAIGYLQGRIGWRIMTISHFLFDIYGEVNVVGDTEREFYNNLIEGGPACRLIIHPEWGLSLTGGYYWGKYINVKSRYRPPEKTYESLRIFLILDKLFR